MEDIPPVSKRSVTQSTVTINQFVGVIHQMTRPGSPGKLYVNLGNKENEDPRLARLPTVIKFPGPSEATAALEQPGKTYNHMPTSLKAVFLLCFPNIRIW